MKKKILTIFLVLIAAITLGACSANTTAYLDASQKVADWKGSKVSGQLEYNVEVKNPKTEELVNIKFPVSLTGEQVGKDKAHVVMNMDFSELKKEIAKTTDSQEEIAGLNKDVPDVIKMDLYVKGNEVIFSKDIFALSNDSFKDIKEDYISIADEENGPSPKAAQYFNSEEFKTDLINLMNLASKDIKQEIDFKVEGNTYTLDASSDAIIDEFIKSADGVMKNWDAVSTSALAIIDKAGLPMDEEERKDFKELNKEYKAEDLKEAAKGIKEMIKGSKISQKTTFEENKLVQDLAMQVNVADFVKVSVKGKMDTVKDENVKINFPTSVKKLTTEEYMKLIMPEVSLVTVRVNGEDITFEDPEALPKIMNDRTMLAARAFYEKIGAKVDWNGKDRTVTVTKDKDKIVLKIDSNKALVNGKEVALDSPAVILNDKTYIPVRFVSEAFGYKVKYDKNEGMPIVDIFNMTEKELEAKLAEIEKEDNYKMIASMKSTGQKDEEIVETLKELYEGEELEKILAAKAELDKNPELLKKYQEENKKELEEILGEDKEEVKEADKEETKEVKEEKLAEKTEKSAEKVAEVLFSVVK